MTRFTEVYEEFSHRGIGCEAAARWLGCSVRHFLRLRERFEAEGLCGLRDHRVGRTSPRRATDAEVALVTGLYREKYQGFSVRHFHEFLRDKHALHKSYSWTKGVLHRAGVVVPEHRGGPHRLRRPRKPMAGMMLHQDASRHVWFGEESCDLVVTMDDATSEIYSAFFCEEEGTMSSFRGLQETLEKQGLFCSLYTDRGSHYFTTLEASGKVDKGRPTQVGRALKHLGIEHIAAYSPQARGRSERMFSTLQDRLVRELAMEGITAMEAANRYLREVYLPRHNTRFTVAPESKQSAFVPLAGVNLTETLCVREERIVYGDNTVRYEGRRLQIPPCDYRQHYVRASVRVHRYPDGRLAIFHGPRCLGRYDASGTLLQPKEKVEKTRHAA